MAPSLIMACFIFFHLLIFSFFLISELYIDEDKKAFETLGFKRFSLFSLPRLMLAKVARDAVSKVR